MSIDIDDDIPTATESWGDYWREMRDSFQVYRWTISELVAHESWPHIRRMFGFLCAMTAISALQPWTGSYIVNGLVTHNASMLRFGLATLGMCLMGKLLANRYRCAEREIVLGENMGRIDVRTTELFLGKSLGQHLHEGDTLSAANVERGRSSVILVQNLLLFDGLQVLLELTLCYMCLWFISVEASIVMSALLVIHVLWMFFFNANINRVCVPIERGFRAMNRYRADRWQHVERVKACGMEVHETRAVATKFRGLIGPDRDFWIWVNDRALWRGMGNYVALAVVTVYGSWKVWNGLWEVGILFPLFTWTGFMVENLWRVSFIEQQLNWNAPSVRSMKRALTLQSTVEDGNVELPASPDGVHVRFENVECSYPDQDGNAAPVLSGITLDIPPHAKVALLGRSGSGKTTFMRLLLRARDPAKGRVLVNGIDLRRLRLASWLKHVGYIAQQPQVFDGTVRDNLLYGTNPGDWPDDALWGLMRRLRVDFGNRLSSGLDTRVGRGGLRLSGGQAQRLMIGAAVARKPWFMAIDEATSSLDSSTERDVQRGLEQALDGAVGALTVTHRLSTVRDTHDLFVVLRSAAEVQPGETQIEAVGHSFEELYAASPTFRELADDQGIIMRTTHSSTLAAISPV